MPPIGLFDSRQKAQHAKKSKKGFWVDRRSFIKKGLWGGILLTVGGSGLLALKKGSYPAPPSNSIKVLDAASCAILLAAAKRIVTAPDADAVDIVMRVDNALTYAPQASQKDFVRGLKLLENAFAGLFFRQRLSLFTELSPGQQDQALQAWRDSRLTVLRGAYHSIRRLCVASHYSTISHGQSLGYPGPPFSPPDAGPIVANQRLSPPYEPKPSPGSPSDSTTPHAEKATTPLHPKDRSPALPETGIPRDGGAP